MSNKVSFDRRKIADPRHFARQFTKTILDQVEKEVILQIANQILDQVGETIEVQILNNLRIGGVRERVSALQLHERDPLFFILRHPLVLDREKRKFDDFLELMIFDKNILKHNH